MSVNTNIPHGAGQNTRVPGPISVPLTYSSGRVIAQPPVSKPVGGKVIVDAADPRLVNSEFPMSITPVLNQLPATQHDSAICETAVAGLLAAGLPPFLAGSAYTLCVKALPAAKRVVGNSATALTKYIINKVQSKFMAGNKITRAPKTRAPRPTGQAGSMKLPGSATIQPAGPAYSRAVRAAPAAFSVRQKGSGRPKVRSSPRGMIISHSEMIGNLVSHATTLRFTATDFTLNPGKFSTFPWLSTLAGNFDKYVMRKLVVHLVSNQPTSVGGKMGIGYDYDSTDPAPTDRNEFFSLTHHIECAPWDSVSLVIPMDNVPRFVNSHTTTDSKLIDCGQVVFMADQIVATNTSLGDMIVEYEVELLDPQQAIYSTMNMLGNTPASFSSLVTTGPVVWTTIPTASTTDLEFNVPQGYYFVTISLRDTGSGSPVVTIAAHNCFATSPYGCGYYVVSSTSNDLVFARVYTEKNDSTIKLTFSSVAIANLEDLLISVTRVSATVYRGTSGLGMTTMSTY